MKDYQLWIIGRYPDQDKNYKYYWDVDMPSKGEYYRNEEYETNFKSEPTYYQIYEIVSQGTLVSPKFATEEEIF